AYIPSLRQCMLIVSGLATLRWATRLPFFSPEAVILLLLFNSPRYFPKFFLFEACGTHSDGLRSTFYLSNISTELNKLGISSSLTHLLGSGCQARRKYMDEEMA
ncbi:hypothetical protein JB92DRAFT_2988008, partial [Gautieria morchelliformis]